MKRAVIAAIILGCVANPANAVIPVFDEVGNAYNQLKLAVMQNELVQTIKSYVVEVKSLAADLQQVASLEAQLQSMVQNPSLGAAQALMGQFGIVDPLGGIPTAYAVMAMTSGMGGAGLSGMINRISALGSTIGNMATVNNVYTCKDQDFACQEQQRIARANAGYQGVIGKVYNDLASHYKVISALRERQGSTTDPAERENLMVALGAEQAWATSAIGQLQAANALYTAQRNVSTSRSEERLEQDIDAMLGAAPKGGG